MNWRLQRLTATYWGWRSISSSKFGVNEGDLSSSPMKRPVHPEVWYHVTLGNCRRLFSFGCANQSIYIHHLSPLQTPGATILVYSIACKWARLAHRALSFIGRSGQLVNDELAAAVAAVGNGHIVLVWTLLTLMIHSPRRTRCFLWV